jgi:hypothetical protein
MFPMPIRIDDSLGVEWSRKQVRFPRSKKKRIQKKWAKDPNNWKPLLVVRSVAFRVGNDYMVMNSLAWQRLREQTTKANS